MTVGRWLAAAALILPATALAQPAQRGWYVGGSLGSATARFDTELTHIDAAVTSSMSSDDKSGYGKIYAGFQLEPWFAVEAGLINLGAYNTTRNISAPASGSVRAEVESAGLHLDAVIMARTQTAFTPFGKIGLVLARTRIEYTTTGGVTLPPGRDAVHEQRDSFLKLAAGIDYAFNRNFLGRIELERMGSRRSSRASGEDVDAYRSLDTVSIGLIYRF